MQMTVWFIMQITIDSVTNLLERNLSYINSWCISNRLLINSSKTKVMYTSTQCRSDRMARYPLKWGNNTIEHVNACVYLGINLDASMSLTLFPQHLYNRVQIKSSHCLKLGK